MKTQYIQPEVQVTEIQSMIVMQAASAPAAGENMGIITGTSTNTQW